LIDYLEESHNKNEALILWIDKTHTQDGGKRVLGSAIIHFPTSNQSPMILLDAILVKNHQDGRFFMFNLFKLIYQNCQKIQEKLGYQGEYINKFLKEHYNYPLNKPEIIDNPDLVATTYSFESAMFFFDKNKLWSICDKGVDDTAITALTKRINGGTHGLEDRIEKTRKYFQYVK